MFVAGKSNRAAERFPQRWSESAGQGAGPAWGDRLPTPFPRQVHKRVAVLCFIQEGSWSEHNTERGQGSLTENPGTGSDILTPGLNLHSWSLSFPQAPVCPSGWFVPRRLSSVRTLPKPTTCWKSSLTSRPASKRWDSKQTVRGWKGCVDADAKSPHAKRSQWNIFKLHDRHSN